MQGYVFKHDVPSRLVGEASNRWRVSLWLIDAYRNDPTASSPLRIDFHVSDNDTQAVKQLLRLPYLTHLCVFKAHLKDSRLFLPLSPNRLQISPNSLAPYLAASDIPGNFLLSRALYIRIFARSLLLSPYRWVLLFL